jgi:hypothetical protein
MKKIYSTLLLSFLIIPIFGSVVSAQGGYYISEEEYRLEEARQDNLEEQGFREDLELESKISAVEEQEEKESQEADQANKQLLKYVAIGVGAIILLSVTGHLWQKHM